MESCSDEEAMDSRDAMKALATINMARDHAAARRHGPATALLMQVPQLADELEAAFTFSLKSYGESLARLGQGNNAIWLYLEAIPLFPLPRGLYTNLGALHYSLGDARAAIASFQKVLKFDPGYWPALESLENVKSLAVDRWHYRMLNHSARNEAYSRAIERAIRKAASRSGRETADVTVLDIGTGTGILAVMAARSGASHVYACEVNGVLCDVAREVLKRNGVADRVTVINKSSGALEPGVDIPSRGVDVVVTELVDSGLLGEQIIPVLADARARGLLAERGCVVPEGACVYAAVLESDTIRRRSRVLPGGPAGLSTGNIHLCIEEPYTCEDLSRLHHRILTVPRAILDVNFLEAGAEVMAPPIPPHLAPEASLPGRRLDRPPVRLPVESSGRADAVAVWFDLWLDSEKGERDVVSTRPERRSAGDASGWDAGIYFSSGAELQAGDTVTLKASPGRDRLHLSLNGQVGIDPSQPPTGNNTSAEGKHKGNHSGVAAGTHRGCGPRQFLLGEMDLARLNDEGFHRAQAVAVSEILAARGVKTAQRWPSCSSKSPRGVFPIPPTSARVTDNEEGKTAEGTASANRDFSAPSPAYILDLCGAWGLAGLLVAQLELDGGRPATRVLALCSDGESEAAAAMNALARENGLGPDRYAALAKSVEQFAFGPGRGTVREAILKTGSGSANGVGNGSLQADGNACCGKIDDECCCWPVQEQGTRSVAPAANNGLRWSVVMASSMVEGSGLLRQGALGDLELCRRFLCGDEGDGGDDSRRESGDDGRHVADFVPGSIEVICQGLQHASLLSGNRVLSSVACQGEEDKHYRCCGVDVTPVNAFGVSNFRELDLSAAAAAGDSYVPHVKMSHSRPAAIPPAVNEDAGDSICEDGTAHRERPDRSMIYEDAADEQEMFLTLPIVCYDLVLKDVRAGQDGCLPRRSSRLRVQRDGTLHAIAYWYRQRLSGAAALGQESEREKGKGAGVMLENGPIAGSWRDYSGDGESRGSRNLSHFRQAAVLLDEPVAVTAGQRIDVTIFCHSSQGVVVQVLGVLDDDAGVQKRDG